MWVCCQGRTDSEHVFSLISALLIHSLMFPWSCRASVRVWKSVWRWSLQCTCVKVAGRKQQRVGEEQEEALCAWTKRSKRHFSALHLSVFITEFVRKKLGRWGFATALSWAFVLWDPPYLRAWQFNIFHVWERAYNLFFLQTVKAETQQYEGWNVFMCV